MLGRCSRTMCGVASAALTLIIVTAMVVLPGAVIDTVAALAAPERHAVNTDIGAVETERDSYRGRRPLAGSGTWMDVPETAQYTGNAGGGEWGSGDTIGQYGVIAAAATTNAAGAPRHANGTGQQADGIGLKSTGLQVAGVTGVAGRAGPATSVTIAQAVDAGRRPMANGPTRRGRLVGARRRQAGS